MKIQWPLLYYVILSAMRTLRPAESDTPFGEPKAKNLYVFKKEILRSLCSLRMTACFHHWLVPLGRESFIIRWWANTHECLFEDFSD